MTTTDQTPKTTPADKPASHAKTTTHRLVNPGNIAAAAAGTGATIVCSQLLTVTAYKAVTGIVFIVLLVIVGLSVHRRFFKADEPSVEETPNGR